LPRTAWWEVDPASESLIGPNSMWMRFGGRAQDAQRLRRENPDPPRGRASRLRTGVAGQRIFVLPDQSNDEPRRSRPAS